jgi:hypothetical protein
MAGERMRGSRQSAPPSPGAAFRDGLQWDQIDWTNAYRNVRRLQARIVKATKEGRRSVARVLQRLLTRSFSGKLLAVRRVTANRGKRTPGVDGETWITPARKAAAIRELRERGYRPKPLRRVYIESETRSCAPWVSPSWRIDIAAAERCLRPRPRCPLGEGGAPSRHHRPLCGRCGDPVSVRGRRAARLPMAPENSPGAQAELASGQDPGGRARARRRGFWLPGASPSHGEVAKVCEVVLAEVAFGSCDGKYPGQGQRDNGAPLPTYGAYRGSGGRAQSGASGLGQLLSLGQLSKEVLPDRRLRSGAIGAFR